MGAGVLQLTFGMTRLASRIGGWLLVAVTLVATTAGCSRTEVVVTVDATELSVPDEIDHIVFTVTNPITDPAGKNPVFVSPQLALCPPGQASSGCTSLPTALTLFPGNERPRDNVRVQLDALRQGTVVLSQASVFTFTPGERAKLTFNLYRDCLQLKCAAFDQGCAAGGVCQNLAIESPSSPDLGASPVTFVGVSSQNAVGVPMFDVQTPGDTQAGDLLILLFSTSVGGEPPTLSAPGWLPITWLNTPEGLNMWMMQRFTSVSEPPVHSFSFTGTPVNFINTNYYLLHFRGATRIEGLRTLVEIGSPTLPSVNIQGPGRMLVSAIQYPNGFNSRMCETPPGMQVLANGGVLVLGQSVSGPALSGDRALTCGLPDGQYGMVAFALAP